MRIEFGVQRWLARAPARRKSEDDEMALDAAVGIARDHLAVAGDRDRLDGKAGFFGDLADDRLGERFARFDPAARQREQAAAPGAPAIPCRRGTPRR
jgi:hypothetical protein